MEEKHLSRLKSWDNLLYLIASQQYENVCAITYEQRKAGMGEVGLLYHYKRELVAQQNALEQDNVNISNAETVDGNMAFQMLALGREGLIQYLKEKIEFMEYPEVPYIGKLVNSNVNISDKILDAYYSLTPQPSPDKIDKSYVGKPHRHTPPYSYSIFGAYPLAKDWEALEIKFDRKKKPYIFESEHVQKSLQDFSNGFKRGYYNFETDILKTDKPNAVIENKVYAQKVFDYVFGSFLGRGGFSETHGDNRDIFANWFNDGIETGRYYRAWYIMIEEYAAFEHLFIEKHNTSRSSSLPITETVAINDFVASTVEDFLDDIKDEVSHGKDYEILVKELTAFFNGNPNKVVKPIFIKKGNKKRLGSRLGRLYKAIKTDAIPYEYLICCKELIGFYNDEKIGRDSFRTSNLYKYLTSKTK